MSQTAPTRSTENLILESLFKIRILNDIINSLQYKVTRSTTQQYSESVLSVRHEARE
jgi:hypothetical protein